jgi:hypothetical protein
MDTGFNSVLFNDISMEIAEIQFITQEIWISYNDSRTITIHHPYLFSFVVENSDNFVNILNLVMNRKSQIESHGLLGQTWRKQGTYTKGKDVAIIEGFVDQYCELDDNIFGCNFDFNRFPCYNRI